MKFVIYGIVALVAMQRLWEVHHSARNTAALKRRGGVEVGGGHYPLIVIMHIAWLCAIIVFLPRDPQLHWTAFGGFLLLQLLRAWVLVSLGGYFTTRIITLKGAPLVRHGPYRFVRHPNYLVVIGEIATLPLACGEIAVAVTFSVLNGILLVWRISRENAALASRRAGGEAA